MAVIRVFEMASLPNGETTRHGRYRAAHSVVIASTSDLTAAFSGDTRYVSVQADAACHVQFGEAPVATTADFKLQSGETADFAVRGGDKCAVIEA